MAAQGRGAAAAFRGARYSVARCAFTMKKARPHDAAGLGGNPFACAGGVARRLAPRTHGSAPRGRTRRVRAALSYFTRRFFAPRSETATPQAMPAFTKSHKTKGAHATAKAAAGSICPTTTRWAQPKR